jgi:hypothetical protein
MQMCNAFAAEMVWLFERMMIMVELAMITAAVVALALPLIAAEEKQKEIKMRKMGRMRINMSTRVRMAAATKFAVAEFLAVVLVHEAYIVVILLMVTVTL